MDRQTTEQKSQLQLCYNALLDKQAEEVLILDLRGVTNIADFFVICHGTSARQVQAISDNVEKVFRKNGHKRFHVEGRAKGDWVLMDFSDMVIHIFHETARGVYSLERLWSDAKKVEVGNMATLGVN